VTPPQPWVSGQALTILATVAPLAPGTGTPTGTVTFYNGSTKLGSGTLNKAATDQTTFVAKLPAQRPTPSLPSTRGHELQHQHDHERHRARRAGTDHHRPAVLEEPSVNGQPVTFTATVTVKSPGSGTPTGQVTFTNGSTTLGNRYPRGQRRRHLRHEHALGRCAHTITATYGGDANDAASLPSTALSQVVNADRPTRPSPHRPTPR